MKPTRINPKRIARILTAAALLTPFAVVQAARVLVGNSGPAAAPGATITPAMPGIAGAGDLGAGVAARKPTPSQQKALDWLNAQRLSPPLEVAREFDLSPMDRAAAPAKPPAPLPPVEPPKIEPVIPAIPAAEALKDLKITAVMGTDAQAGGAIAVIGGKLRRAGDEVAPGWTISSINARDWVVLLTYKTGESATLSGMRPQQNR
jgi:hypothetical protein